MNKRVKVFITAILSIIICLTLLVPVYATSRNSHYDGVSGYTGSAYVIGTNCHSGEVSTSVQVRCTVHPVTNPGAGSYIMLGNTGTGALRADSSYTCASSNAISETQHACRVFCDTCAYAVGGMSSYH